MIIKDGLKNSFANGISRILVICSFIFSSNFMIESDYALSTSLITLCITFQMLGASGITIGFNYFTSKYKHSKILYTYHTNLVLILFLMILFIGIFIFVSLNFINFGGILSEFSKGEINYLILYVVLTILSSSAKGILLAYQKINTIFTVNILSSLFMLISIGCIYFSSTFGKLTLFIPIITGVIVEAFLYFSFTKNLIKFKKKFLGNTGEIKEITKYIIPSTASSILIQPINIYLLNLISISGSQKELTTYNIYNQLRNMMTFVQSSIATISLSRMTKNIEEFRKAFWVTNATSVFVAIVFFLCSSIIFSLYNLNLGDDLIIISSILCIHVLFSSLSLIYGQKLNAKGKTMLGLVANLLWVFFILVITLFGLLVINLINLILLIAGSYIFLLTVLFILDKK